MSFAPLAEEYLFRWPLGASLKWRAYSVRAILILLLFKAAGFEHISSFLFIGFFIFLLIYISTWKKNSDSYFFWSLTVSFALAHIRDGLLTGLNILFMPFFLFPHLVVGCICGYLRIRFGIQFSIFFHFLWNVILIVMSFIFNS